MSSLGSLCIVKGMRSSLDKGVPVEGQNGEVRRCGTIEAASNTTPWGLAVGAVKGARVKAQQSKGRGRDEPVEAEAPPVR